MDLFSTYFPQITGEFLLQVLMNHAGNAALNASNAFIVIALGGAGRGSDEGGGLV